MTSTVTPAHLGPVWSRPGEARKALIAGAVAFIGPAVIAVNDTVHNGWSFVALSLWLTAVVTGLAAIAGVFWFPNDPAGKKALTDDIVKTLLDVAARKPAGTVLQDATATVADAETSWKHKYVQGNATPPAPMTVSTSPYVTVASEVPQVPVQAAAAEPAAPPAYTGPIPPITSIPAQPPSAPPVL